MAECFGTVSGKSLARITPSDARKLHMTRASRRSGCAASSDTSEAEDSASAFSISLDMIPSFHTTKAVVPTTRLAEMGAQDAGSMTTETTVHRGIRAGIWALLVSMLMDISSR